MSLVARAVSAGSERFPLSAPSESRAVDGRRIFAKLALAKFHFCEPLLALRQLWNRPTSPMAQLSSCHRLNNLHSSSTAEHLQHLLVPLTQLMHQPVLGPFRATSQLHHQGPSRQARQQRARLRVQLAVQLGEFHPFLQVHLLGAHHLTHELLRPDALAANLAALLLNRLGVTCSMCEVN